MSKIVALIRRLRRSLAYRLGYGVQQCQYRCRRLLHRLITVHLALPRWRRALVVGDRGTGDSRASRILLLRYKYAGGNPRFGLSPEEHATYAPLAEAGIGEIDQFYFDVDHRQSLRGERHIIDRAARFRPDLLVLSSYDPWNAWHPYPEVLQAIRAVSSLPTLLIWHDSVGDSQVELARRLENLVDLHLVMDSSNLCRRFGEDRFLRLWVPLTQTIFHAGGAERDIPVSFVGSTESYRDVRKPFLEYLSAQGMPLLVTGGQHQESLSLEDYALVLRRSKITLNFSHSIPGKHQEKARVFEALFSGALLMENSGNEETKLHFTPMVDYVEFDSKEDLLDKVRYYLDNEDERNEIASNGHANAVQQFGHRQFWDRALKRIEQLGLGFFARSAEA